MGESVWSPASGSPESLDQPLAFPSCERRTTGLKIQDNQTPDSRQVKSTTPQSKLTGAL